LDFTSSVALKHTISQLGKKSFRSSSVRRWN